MKRVVPFLFLAACSASPAAPASPIAPSSSSSSAAPDAAPTASATPTTSAKAPVATATAVASSAPVAPPATLTATEREEMKKSCKPILDAIALSRSKGKRPDEALEQVLASPPKKVDAPVVARCGELLRREIASYMQATMEVEAQTTVTMISKLMVAAYEMERPDGSTHLLCGSMPAVPADLHALDKGPIKTIEADWSAWKCARFSLADQAQRYQYDVQVNGARFVVRARGYTADRARLVTISLAGEVRGDGIALEKPTRAESALP
jgi:hypothetical protein